MRSCSILLVALALLAVVALTVVDASPVASSSSLESHPTLPARRFAPLNRAKAEGNAAPKKKAAAPKKAAPKKVAPRKPAPAPKRRSSPVGKRTNVPKTRRGKATGTNRVTADVKGSPSSPRTTNTAGPQVGSGAIRYTYSQSSGLFNFGNGHTARGYSGRVPGTINNPAKQNVQAPCQSGARCDKTPAGPIPRGTYTVSSVVASGHKRGPWTAVLQPSPSNSMMGRSGFLIHGANSRDTATNKVSSTGCIILPRADRQRLKRGAVLTVTN